MRESRPTKRCRNPREGETWRHFKGGSYLIVGRSKEHDTGEINVLYTSAGAPTWDPWSRPMPEFMAEVKNDEGEWVHRFERVNWEAERAFRD